MTLFALIFIFLLGGIAGRIRGSDWPINDSEKRYLVWGGAVAVLVLFITHNILYALAALPLAGLGATMGYHGQFDLTVAANRNWKNYAALTATACFRFLPLFIAACFVPHGWHTVTGVLAGVTFVPVYLFCATYLQNLKFTSLFSSWTCWGEFLFWGSIYTALAVGLYA